MQLSAAVTAAARPAGMATAFGLMFVLLMDRGAGQQPAPVAPTIPAPAIARITPGHPNRVTMTTAQPAGPNGGPHNGEKADNGEKDAAEAGPELTLGECVAIALERQPAIRADLASQQATEAGLRGLNGIGKLGQALSPDLPIRKEQAARGVTAAAADIQKRHNEVVHDVTRMYLTAVYAGQQLAEANEVVPFVEQLVEIATEVLKSPMPGTMTKTKLDLMKMGLAKARELREMARYGRLRALAGLREAMAVGPDFVFRPKQKALPVMAQNVPLTREQVIEMAVCRRPELALAAAGVDAFRLEVYAQGKIPFRRAVPTLASGSDIHAREVPQAVRTDRDYRPGAIAPEMPVQLVGTKYDRVCRAMAYSQRAEAVYEKARNLIVLEAETAFYDLELASHRMTFAKEKADRGQEIARFVRENFTEARDKDQLLQAYAAAAQAQGDYAEAVFQHLLALAGLERVTAGGVRPAFPGR